MTANEIIPGIWISDAPFLHRLRHDRSLIPDLVAILNVTHGFHHTENRLCRHVHCLHLPFHNDPQPDQQHNVCNKLKQALNFIDRFHPYGSVLIHCTAGINRSASVLAIWLSRTFHYPLRNAIDLIRRKRSIVHPHPVLLQMLTQCRVQ